jgi:hypothetical protein
MEDGRWRERCTWLRVCHLIALDLKQLEATSSRLNFTSAVAELKQEVRNISTERLGPENRVR